MRSFSWLFLFCSTAICFLSTNANATTRAPSSAAEKSLLYWRYLCKDQPQTEIVTHKREEFACPSQGWRVIASVDEKIVKEVIENDDH